MQLTDAERLILKTLRDNSRAMNRILFRLQHGQNTEFIDTRSRAEEELVLGAGYNNQLEIHAALHE